MIYDDTYSMDWALHNRQLSSKKRSKVSSVSKGRKVRATIKRKKGAR